MINYVIDLTGLIISILGLILVLRSRILEKRSFRYFLWIFVILIAYAVTDLISWLTYEKVGKGWMLASKIGLFLASAFSGALIPLLSGFLLYSAGEENVFRNRVFHMILVLFVLYLGFLTYAQFSTAIYYYDESNTKSSVNNDFDLNDLDFLTSLGEEVNKTEKSYGYGRKYKK